MEFNFGLGIDDEEGFIRETRAFNVGDLLRKSARMYQNRVAVSEPGREVTYGKLDDRVNALANALRARGYEPGEARIALLSENRGEMIEVMYAGAKLGCLVPALNWRLEREELVHCVDLVEPEVLVTTERFREKAGWIEADAEHTPTVVTMGDDAEEGDTSYETLIQEGPPRSRYPRRESTPSRGWSCCTPQGPRGCRKAS
jgi:fatty-acyl-CoA synthase